MKAKKANSVLFFLPKIWWLDALKRIEKIIGKIGFWAKEKETQVKISPWVSANRPSNNWAQWNSKQPKYISLNVLKLKVDPRLLLDTLRASSPPFFPRDSRASETRARVKITPRANWVELNWEKATRGGKKIFAACCHFSRGVIFTRACVSLALLS